MDQYTFTWIITCCSISKLLWTKSLDRRISEIVLHEERAATRTLHGRITEISRTISFFTQNPMIISGIDLLKNGRQRDQEKSILMSMKKRVRDIKKFLFMRRVPGM